MITQQTYDAVAAALVRLGTDRDSVAHTLRARGIKGRRGAAAACPVARYLQEEFPDVDQIVVNVRTVIINREHDVLAPGPVRRFIQAFDNFTYGDLRE